MSYTSISASGTFENILRCPLRGRYLVQSGRGADGPIRSRKLKFADTAPPVVIVVKRA
jgi:hypothetical protein